MRDAFCVLFAALADRCCEFIAWSDRELDQGLSRAIFLHVGDKCQTVGGAAVDARVVIRVGGNLPGVDGSGVV